MSTVDELREELAYNETVVNYRRQSANTHRIEALIDAAEALKAQRHIERIRAQLLTQEG